MTFTDVYGHVHVVDDLYEPFTGYFYLERVNGSDMTTMSTQQLRVEYAKTYQIQIENQEITDIFQIYTTHPSKTVLATIVDETELWDPGNYTIQMEMSNTHQIFGVQVDMIDESTKEFDYLNLFVELEGTHMHYLGHSTKRKFPYKLIPSQGTLNGVVKHQALFPTEFSETLVDGVFNNITVPINVSPVTVKFKTDNPLPYHFNHHTTGPMNEDQLLLKVEDGSSSVHFFYLDIHTRMANLYLPPGDVYHMTLGIDASFMEQEPKAHFFLNSEVVFNNTSPSDIVYDLSKYTGRVAVQVERDSQQDESRMILLAHVDTPDGDRITMRSFNFVYRSMDKEYGMLLPFGDAHVHLKTSPHSQPMASAQLSVQAKHTTLHLPRIKYRNVVFRPKFGSVRFNHEHPWNSFNVYTYDSAVGNVTTGMHYPHSENLGEIKLSLQLGTYYYRYWRSGELRNFTLTEFSHYHTYIEDDLTDEAALLKGNFYFNEHNRDLSFMSCVGFDPYWMTNLMTFPGTENSTIPNIVFQTLIPAGLFECNLQSLYHTDLLSIDAGNTLELHKDDFQRTKL